MGLKKDYSIVADSVMTSSPPFTTSPAPIGRAAKTYGRRREEPDRSFTYSEHDSRDSIYRTGPPGISDEVPPSEPSKWESDNEGEDDADGDILPSFLATGFGWKEKMKKIDDEEDLSGYINLKDADECAPATNDAHATPTSMDTDVESPVTVIGARTTQGAMLGDVFGSSFSSFASPSEHAASSEPKNALGVSRNRPRLQKNIITSGDDMDQSDKHGTLPSSPETSPLHPIATPKSQLTTSPPTSHHDDVSTNSTAFSKSKGKGKAPKVRHTVAPLRFDSPPSDDLEDVVRPRGTLGRREKKQRVKAPTKKEKKETVRERARIAAGQQVSIAKPVVTESRNLTTFFNKIAQRQGLQLAAPRSTEVPGVQPPSSPIGDFSSQPQPDGGDAASGPSATSEIRAASKQTPSPRPLMAKDNQLVLGNRAGSVGLPDTGAILNSANGNEKLDEDDAQVRKRRITQRKLELLQKQQMQKSQAEATEDDDDELQIVAPTEIEAQRKSAEKKKTTKGKRMLLAHARVQSKPLTLDPKRSTKEDLDIAQEVILKQGTSDPRVLSAFMRQRAEKESLAIVKQKEEEWKRLGGIVKEEGAGEPVDSIQRNQVILEYTKKGVETWGEKGQRSGTASGDDDDGDDEEEEDPDWSPEARGSMSPTPLMEDEEIDYEKMEMGEVNALEDEEQSNQSDGEDEQVPVIKVRTKNRPRDRILDSDESGADEYHNEDAVLPKPRGTECGVSSSDDRTEDENDKENNTRLMFDRSEDKENKAVVRYGPLSGPSFTSIFDGESDRDLSLSPPHVMAVELETNGASVSPNRRKPLGIISDASPVSVQQEPSTLTQAFAAQLKHLSPARSPVDEDVFGPVASTPAASLDFAPVFGGVNSTGKEKPPLAFSQFSQGGTNSMTFGAPALLQPGFSDLFDSNTQNDIVTTQGLRRQESLGLTQDLALQPAFQVNEKLLRKADAIFDKEQEYVVEATSKKDTKEQEFYINEVGLLTQTRPSASSLGTRSSSFVFSPTQTRSQQTQRPPCSTLPSQPRPPLRTISLSNPQLSSPEASPKRRLRKRGETLTPRGSPVRSPLTRKTVSPAPRQLNAFDLLGKPPPKVTGKGKGKESALGKLVRQEWLAEEAEESDEELMAGFGFIGKRNEEAEEAEGADLDATLTELVDDQKMDEETEGVDKVIEKHKELLEQDDEAALKFHQGVVQGEMRKKRKNRFGLDDSDDEDEEDDRARRIRRKMRERTERGDIQELAANDKTAAFANVYQTGLIDDEIIETRPLDLDLAFRTEREMEGEDVIMNDGQDREQEDQNDAGEAEDEGDKNNYITYKDIQAKVRRMREQPEEEIEVPDYEDVSWIDEQDDNETEPVQVRVVTNANKKPARDTSTIKQVTGWDVHMLGGTRRKENEKDVERSRAWAKNEVRMMTGSTGRLVGGIAVTGHGNRTKNGGGSLRSKASLGSVSADSSSNLGGKKPVKAEGSVLAGIAKRKDQFQ